MIWVVAAKWVLGRLRGAWSLFMRHPVECALAIALLLCWGLYARGNRYRDDLTATLAAQQAATQAQVAVNHEPARKSAAVAEKSYVDSKVYYEQGRRAGLAYADAHRVRNSCAPRAADLPRTDSPAPVDDGPGENPDLVALTREDFDTLTGNSLRLAKVQQDASELIEQGVAVAMPDPAFAQ